MKSNNDKVGLLKKIIYIIELIIVLSSVYVVYLKITNQNYNNKFIEEEYNLKIGETIKIINDNYSNYIFESTNNNIVTVDSQGKITALDVGTAQVIIKNLNDKNITKYIINVSNYMTSLKLDKTSLELEIGNKYKLTATIIPDTSNYNITWLSDNNNIVSVDNGNVIALNEGVATVIASTEDGRYKVECKIVVTKPTVVSVTGITLETNKIEMNLNEILDLSFSISPMNAANKNVIWTSSDNNIVKVENGKIVARSPGIAIITAKTEDGGYTATTTVTVKNSIKIHFIRQNDSADVILLESNGHFAMIDSGLYDDRQIVIDYLNELNVRELDFLLITHNHKDHISTAPTLIKRHFENIGTVYIKTYLGTDNNYSTTSQSRYDKVIETATEKNIPIKYIEKLCEGYTIKFDKMTIQLYNTIQQMVEGKYYGKNENYNSVYQLVTINGTKTFLASDGFSKNTLDPTIDIIDDIDLLKMPHHGYNSCGVTDSSAAKMSPENIVITNSYERLNGQYDCINRFSNIPRYFVNNSDIKKSIIVDYSDGNIKVIKN